MFLSEKLQWNQVKSQAHFGTVSQFAAVLSMFYKSDLEGACGIQGSSLDCTTTQITMA
jgi:hypothetical protein